MANIFNAETLAEKLAKLNNSQQSIETLSHWCIFHRKKARQVVETWEKQFSNSKEQQVPLLYLANDILQNSRRKGSEFVNEFWKVLPRALINIINNGDEQGKNVVTRLVDIWDERKVFGSRSKSLKDEMMGKEVPSASVENNGMSSNLIKTVKKDSHTLRIKLAIGGMPEKILTAFQSVLDENVNEDVAVHRSRAAIQQVVRMEKEVMETGWKGNHEPISVVNAIQEQEDILGQCIEQLEGVKASREALIFQLKEALQQQESQMELVRNQLQIIRSEKERAINLKQRLSGSNLSSVSGLESVISMTSPQPPQLHPVTSIASYLTNVEVQNKKAAAEVAAKLTASTSSAQMLSSVLSSLVAEEAASKYPAGTFPPEKRSKLEKPLAGVSDASPIFPGQPPPPPLAPPISQNYPLQPPLPPQPPPPQYTSSSGPMVNVLPYGYGSSILPPPTMTRPGQPPTLPQQQNQQQQHEQSVFYQSPGMGFYGQPSAAPLPRH